MTNIMCDCLIYNTATSDENEKIKYRYEKFENSISSTPVSDVKEFRDYSEPSTSNGISSVIGPLSMNGANTRLPRKRTRNLENLVTTGMLEGKRSRGKQREKLIEGLTDWLKAGKSLEAIEATKDRKKWRTMIANAVKQGT
ncbi:hypothetical protein PoB_006029600 [Plakobranchus ocellatus]|uniref:Regulatory protein zeste n=1 Tax=Plakobranchus ocellatus TaxID=259542 RepID=A0AAV4CPI2_9GAST|nr:hypothetical protein PoB_006029600 [Plakobranchus ocellatus]